MKNSLIHSFDNSLIVPQKRLNILYRGPLESCNYDCRYCPFAKKKNTRAELAHDRACLEKFTTWVAQQSRPIGILFTPWGEALIRRYYQENLAQLSHLPQVKKVAIQTNISCGLTWLKNVNKDSFALWTTFHQTEVSVEKFLEKCEVLFRLNISFSVGIVGKKEHFEHAAILRQRLPASVYVWVNAYKREPNYYTAEGIRFLNDIDPHFDLNNTIYQTKNKACFAGETSISIDGKGDVKRCHFIAQKIGNIYEQPLSEILAPSPCSNTSCRCYIGYMNLKSLNLEEIYGDKVLERIAL